MEVDEISSLGGYSASQHPKKRKISFDLISPAKRRKLALEQKVSPVSILTHPLKNDPTILPDSPSTTASQDSISNSDDELCEDFGRFDHNNISNLYTNSFRHKPNMRYHPSLNSSSNPSFEAHNLDQNAKISEQFNPSFESEQEDDHSINEQKSMEEWLQKCYDKVESSQLFQDSPFWLALLAAKKEGCKDPRFTPKLLEVVSDKLQTSVVLNLYAGGFSFDDQEQTYPFARNTVAISDAINYGILPGQLEALLQRSQTSSVEGAPKPPTITFYEGGIIVEVRDFREGRAIYNEATQTLQPHCFKLFLRPDFHGFLHYLDSQPVAARVRAVVEQSLTTGLHPNLHLEPDIENTKRLWNLHFSLQKNNIPFKSRASRRRKYLAPLRETYDLPQIIVSEDVQIQEDQQNASFAETSRSSLSSTLFNTTQPKLASHKSKLFSHLQNINFNLEFQKDADANIGTSSEKRRNSPTAGDPSLTEQVNPHPSIQGSFLFTIPPRPLPSHLASTGLAQPLDFAALEINNKNSASQTAFEMYHGSLRFGNNKPLHFPLGGPSSASQFLTQFKKLETPATSEQVKMFTSSNRSSVLPGQPGQPPHAMGSMAPIGTTPVIGGPAPIPHPPGTQPNASQANPSNNTSQNIGSNTQMGQNGGHMQAQGQYLGNSPAQSHMHQGQAAHLQAGQTGHLQAGQPGHLQGSQTGHLQGQPGHLQGQHPLNNAQNMRNAPVRGQTSSPMSNMIPGPNMIPMGMDANQAMRTQTTGSAPPQRGQMMPNMQAGPSNVPHSHIQNGHMVQAQTSAHQTRKIAASIQQQQQMAGAHHMNQPHLASSSNMMQSQPGKPQMMQNASGNPSLQHQLQPGHPQAHLVNKNIPPPSVQHHQGGGAIPTAQSKYSNMPGARPVAQAGHTKYSPGVAPMNASMPGAPPVAGMRGAAPAHTKIPAKYSAPPQTTATTSAATTTAAAATTTSTRRTPKKK